MIPRSAPQRVHVVLNPHAGGGRAESAWPTIEGELRRRFPFLTILRTTQAGEERALGQRAVREGSDLVIAAGGDGTLSGVVDGVLSEPPKMLALPPAVAVLPVGSGSDYARGLDLPRDPLEAAKHLATGEPRQLDVGRLTFLEETPPRVRYWVNQSYLGFGALVVARVNRATGRRGPSSYSRAVLPELWHFHPVALRMTGGGAPPGTQTISNLVVALGRYSGGGMLSSPRSDPSDGKFDVISVGPVSRLRLLRNLSRFRTGRHLLLKEVSTWASTGMEVRAENASTPVIVEADGDIVGQLPVRYELLPKALTFWA